MSLSCEVGELSSSNLTNDLSPSRSSTPTPRHPHCNLPPVSSSTTPTLELSVTPYSNARITHTAYHGDDMDHQIRSLSQQIDALGLGLDLGETSPAATSSKSAFDDPTLRNFYLSPTEHPSAQHAIVSPPSLQGTKPRVTQKTRYYHDYEDVVFGPFDIRHRRSLKIIVPKVLALLGIDPLRSYRATYFLHSPSGFAVIHFSTPHVAREFVRRVGKGVVCDDDVPRGGWLATDLYGPPVNPSGNLATPVFSFLAAIDE